MITGINGSFVERNDQSSLNRFLTQSNWSEEKLNEKRLTLLQEKDMGWKKSGCISIDDVLIEKTGKKIVEIGKLFDIARVAMLMLSSLQPAIMLIAKSIIQYNSYNTLKENLRMQVNMDLNQRLT